MCFSSTVAHGGSIDESGQMEKAFQLLNIDHFLFGFQNSLWKGLA